MHKIRGLMRQSCDTDAMKDYRNFQFVQSAFTKISRDFAAIAKIMHIMGLFDVKKNRKLKCFEFVPPYLRPVVCKRG